MKKTLIALSLMSTLAAGTAVASQNNDASGSRLKAPVMCVAGLTQLGFGSKALALAFIKASGANPAEITVTKDCDGNYNIPIACMDGTIPGKNNR